MVRHSAGILLYRRNGSSLQVLLAHPGGPFWTRKDLGAWTIPKGEVHDGEDVLAAARREFTEEIGFAPSGEELDLGEARQSSGKRVHIWAVRGDWDPTGLVSTTFPMEWPPRSGKTQTFPEIDRAEWFPIEQAHEKILPGQAVFLDRLQMYNV